MYSRKACNHLQSSYRHCSPFLEDVNSAEYDLWPLRLCLSVREQQGHKHSSIVVKHYLTAEIQYGRTEVVLPAGSESWLKRWAPGLPGYTYWGRLAASSSERLQSARSGWSRTPHAFSCVSSLDLVPQTERIKKDLNEKKTKKATGAE